MYNLDLTYFLKLAQCVSNIDRFGYPDPRELAKANDEIFNIDLIDKT
jgi:hypothetical protein